MPNKVRAVTLLIATEDGVAEYSWQNAEMWLDYQREFLHDQYRQAFDLRQPIVTNEKTRVTIDHPDYWKGNATRMHLQSGTPIYDQLKKERAKEAYGG